ncbi:hypothetical protein LNKW23_41060 [Paralimibaculum aggregatum]|uniref:Uncharacterized protein n=1 Tax=Paralimibaculum aggregatum TaxID=3036245 RepID=A0ABQ6LQJ8_9RHOB|nr:hypothetical protein LNKW23_41060 [Limibaculum sp. NKW23]
MIRKRKPLRDCGRPFRSVTAGREGRRGGWGEALPAKRRAARAQSSEFGALAPEHADPDAISGPPAGLQSRRRARRRCEGAPGGECLRPRRGLAAERGAACGAGRGMIRKREPLRDYSRLLPSVAGGRVGRRGG